MYKKEQYNQEIWYNIAVEILMDLVDLNFNAKRKKVSRMGRDPYGSRGSKFKVLLITHSLILSRSLWISWI